MDNVKRHLELCEELHILYAKKNQDYGDSFHETFMDEGMAASRIRLTDKLNRFKRLSSWKTVQNVSGESIRDTLIDLANYALMTIIEMDRMGAEDDPSDSYRAEPEQDGYVTWTRLVEKDRLFDDTSVPDYPWSEYDAVRDTPPVRVRPALSKTDRSPHPTTSRVCMSKTDADQDGTMSKTECASYCDWIREN